MPETEEKMLEATRAVAHQEFLSGFLVDQELTIIDRLIAYFRNGNLAHDVLVGQIAQIALIREMETKLGLEVKKAIRNVENLTGEKDGRSRRT